MSKIIITTEKELSVMIHTAVSEIMNPLQHLINSKLNPQKTNVEIQYHIF